MIINALIEQKHTVQELLSIPEISAIYLPGELYEIEELGNAIRLCHENGKKAYYAFPYIFRQEAISWHEDNVEFLRHADIDGFLIRSLDEIGFLCQFNLIGEYILDAGMYTWNREAMQMLQTWGANCYTAPYELNRRELKERGQGKTELVIYGRLPLMFSAQCFQKQDKTCLRSGREEIPQPRSMIIKDRKGAKFLAENRCRYCYNVLFNSVPLWLLDQQNDFPERVRFHFTDEEKGKAAKIIKNFLQGDVQPPFFFTRGHFARGVE